MAAEKQNNLEDLMLGRVGEEATESDESFQERLAAAQAKLAGIRRDEKKDKNFDQILAKIIPSLHKHVLYLVVFLIDHEVPSLTILAIISLVSHEADKECHHELSKNIPKLELPSDPLRQSDSAARGLNSKVKTKLTRWWGFIFAADRASVTTKLADFQHHDTFVEFVSLEFSKLLERFLQQEGGTDFDKNQLAEILQPYQALMFNEQ